MTIVSKLKTVLQRGPNGELEEVTQTEELQVEGNESEEHLSEEPPLPLATIIEETTEVCLAVYLFVYLFVSFYIYKFKYLPTMSH